MRKCSPWSIKDEGEKLRNEPYEYLLFLKIHTEMKKLVSLIFLNYTFWSILWPASTYFSWFTSLTFTDPHLGSPITFFYWVPPPLWLLIPLTLIFTEVPPPKGSLITYFYWYPLGLPQGDTWPVGCRECYDSCPASCCHSDRSVVGRRSLIGCRWLRCWAAWHTRVGGRPWRNLSP